MAFFVADLDQDYCSGTLKAPEPAGLNPRAYTFMPQQQQHQAADDISMHAVRNDNDNECADDAELARQLAAAEDRDFETASQVQLAGAQ